MEAKDTQVRTVAIPHLVDMVATRRLAILSIHLVRHHTIHHHHMHRRKALLHPHPLRRRLLLLLPPKWQWSPLKHLNLTRV